MPLLNTFIGNHENSARYEFRMLSKLGEGTFGSVYTVESKSDQIQYALKLLPIPENIFDRVLIDREISILSKLNHDHIVQCYQHVILTSANNDYIRIPHTFENPYNYTVLGLLMELCDCDLTFRFRHRMA